MSYHSGYRVLFCSFYFYLLFIFLGQSIAEKKLKTIVLVYRHGDRSPINTYHNDKYQESSWLDGFGQLTKIGIQQHYELGTYLRKRYTGFLNESYNRHEVYVRSTDVDRTLMSAQANLAGLFPPAGEQVWNSSIPWQPIPVHTVSRSQDNLLYLPYNNCPRFKKLQDATRLSQEFHRLIDPYEGFLKQISINTGFTVEELKRQGGWVTYDALFCESVHNYTLPSWVTLETMTKLRTLSEILLEALFGIYKQHEKSRLQGGVLLDTIIKNITHIVSKPSSKRKLFMYSAHDTTIAALQAALNVSNGKMPPYAACHIFELHEDDGQHIIEMYYRNDSTVEPYPLTLPGCNFSCPLQIFQKLTSQVISQDWVKDCGIVDKQSASIVGLSITVALLIFLVTGLLFVICHHKKASYESV
ncbi:prostatic acid phosphatase [Pelodytes ibericus]